jgi:hypothetical protein
MPAGEIWGIEYWYSGLTQWMPLGVTPPQVPLSTELYLMCWWLNTGAMAAKGRVTGVITRPDGSQVSLEGIVNQDKYADPSNGHGVQLSSIVLDQIGSHDGLFKLEMEEAAGLVSISLRARNAPSNAAYWGAICASYPTCPFTSIDAPIVWENIPPSTSQDYILVVPFDSNFHSLLDLPNVNIPVGFSRPFEDDKIYWWDFERGLLLDEFFQPM